MNAPNNTTEQIMRALRSLPEGDRVRILQFTLAILQDRQGKRQQRRSRFQQPDLNDWRIGQ